MDMTRTHDPLRRSPPISLKATHSRSVPSEGERLAVQGRDPRSCQARSEHGSDGQHPIARARTPAGVLPTDSAVRLAAVDPMGCESR